MSLKPLCLALIAALAVCEQQSQAQWAGLQTVAVNYGNAQLNNTMGFYNSSISNTLATQAATQQAQFNANLAQSQLTAQYAATPVNYTNPIAQASANQAYINASQNIASAVSNQTFAIQQSAAQTQNALAASFGATDTKNRLDYVDNLFKATVATEMMYSGLSDQMSAAYQGEMANAAPGEDVGASPGTVDYNNQVNNYSGADLGNNITWDNAATVYQSGSTVGTPVNSGGGSSNTFPSAFQPVGPATTDGLDMSYRYSPSALGVFHNIETLLNGGNLNASNFNDWRAAETALTPESIEAAQAMSTDFARYESAYQEARGTQDSGDQGLSAAVGLNGLPGTRDYRSPSMRMPTEARDGGYFGYIGNFGENGAYNPEGSGYDPVQTYYGQFSTASDGYLYGNDLGTGITQSSPTPPASSDFDGLAQSSIRDIVNTFGDVRMNWQNFRTSENVFDLTAMDASERELWEGFNLSRSLSFGLWSSQDFLGDDPLSTGVEEYLNSMPASTPRANSNSNGTQRLIGDSTSTTPQSRATVSGYGEDPSALYSITNNSLSLIPSNNDGTNIGSTINPQLPSSRNPWSVASINNAGQAAAALARNTASLPTVSPASIAACKGQAVTTASNSILRFFMASNGEHFLTGSLDEGCNTGYAFEGEAFRLFDASSRNAKPLYRCVQGTLAQGHSAAVEKDCGGGTNEGVYGYLLSQPTDGTVPLYRVQFPQSRDALVTVREYETNLPGASNKVILGYVLPPTGQAVANGGK